MSHSHSDHHSPAPEHAAEPIATVGFYGLIFAALVALTLLTIGLGFLELGRWHFLVGMIIATTKAVLVVLFFMHFIHSARLTWVVFAAGLFWLAIMMNLTMADYATRTWSTF
jgi:cytochrome c oxidase subunit 4